ncbi:hypothetical protein BZM26_07905 [Paraburkholderia strydomiana]|nr:hypothetical protein BZM26_07905 [Paraburkholderia strydomiana]
MLVIVAIKPRNFCSGNAAITNTHRAEINVMRITAAGAAWRLLRLSCRNEHCAALSYPLENQ